MTEEDYIYTYTRQQAIADGVLIDAGIGDLAEVTRQHFHEHSVAITAALFDLIETAVNNKKYANDYRGVWHDICFISIVLPTRKLATPDCITTWFKVIITGTGRNKYHELKRVMMSDGAGGVEITYMLADEN